MPNNLSEQAVVKWKNFATAFILLKAALIKF
ncbi:hypothetical protein AM202_01980 [Actinobacillus minor 202]|uniref:Uncharacterized protein n=1 Tax=Actinobacillus minor 202 TaxID=591023 RepID=A0ABP2GSW1_9PAST|nr:hypothetical protein AM202_01980 [Actinobacillus minor 202]